MRTHYNNWLDKVGMVVKLQTEEDPKMLSLVTILCVFVSSAYGQGPDYQCSTGFCSRANGYSRADVLGCLNFCHLDKNGDMSLSRYEYEQDQQSCATSRPTGVCDQASFTTYEMNFLPICTGEANKLYNNFSTLDGDASTVSVADADTSYTNLVNAAGEEPVGPVAYRAYFNKGYQVWGDATCSTYYP